MSVENQNSDQAMSSRIRVLHICDKFSVNGSSIHGVSRMFSWIFPRFDKTRFDVKLLGLRPADSASEDLRSRGVPIECLGRSKFDFSTVFELRRVIRQEQPQVLHLHGYGACTFGRMAAIGQRVKCVVHEHFVDPVVPKVQVPFDYLLANRCDYGIAASRSVKDFMVKRRYLDANKIKVVYYGTSLAEFTSVDREKINVERAKWKVPPGSKIIGYVGRLDEQKGVPYLIAAASELLKDGMNIKLIIVGDGPMLPTLRKQCDEQSISESVIFTGHSSNVPAVMSAFDIQVFPSLWEGSPLALFESMAVGLPIVSTNVDGLGEVLRHNESALLVRPRSSRELSKAIHELVNNPAKAVKLATEAKNDSAKYDVQNTVTAMENIYAELSALN